MSWESWFLCACGSWDFPEYSPNRVWCIELFFVALWHGACKKKMQCRLDASNDMPCTKMQKQWQIKKNFCFSSQKTSARNTAGFNRNKFVHTSDLRLYYLTHINTHTQAFETLKSRNEAIKQMFAYIYIREHKLFEQRTQQKKSQKFRGNLLFEFCLCVFVQGKPLCIFCCRVL